MTLAAITLALLAFTLSFVYITYATPFRIISGVFFLLAIAASLVGCAGNANIPSDAIFLTLTADPPIDHIDRIEIRAKDGAVTSLPTQIPLSDVSLPPIHTVLLHFPGKTGELTLTALARDKNQNAIAGGESKSTLGKNIHMILVPILPLTPIDASSPLDASTLDSSPTPTPDMTVLPPSCQHLDPILCQSLPLPGGTFLRNYDKTPGYDDPSFPAHIMPGRLDRYEVTVSRFRAFVNSGSGTQALSPAPGSGAHPTIPESGWDAAWTPALAPNTPALLERLHCEAAHETWTDTPAGNESKPQNCVSWYEAFAFCIWDGGRLPTEAEWNFAASGGDEQRVYPWGDAPVDVSRANYCTMPCTITDVSSHSPFGDGKWGHADLSGNVWEWTLDHFGTPPNPCNDCANLDPTLIPRVIRGGSFSVPQESSVLRAQARDQALPSLRDNSSGFRCIRD